MPISRACEELGLCETNLKKRCRELGLTRWPFRQLQNLLKKRCKLELQLHRDPSLSPEQSFAIKERQDSLMKEITGLLKNPLTGELPFLCLLTLESSPSALSLWADVVEHAELHKRKPCSEAFKLMGSQDGTSQSMSVSLGDALPTSSKESSRTMDCVDALLLLAQGRSAFVPVLPADISNKLNVSYDDLNEAIVESAAPLKKMAQWTNYDE